MLETPKTGYFQDFEEILKIWKMMIFNTKVLKITKFMILAEISQNMADDNRNVMKYTH